LGLGVKLRRLGYEVKLALKGGEEFMAEIGNLFLVPLIGLADLSNRTVRDR
jgi:hypothetical protein